MPCAWPSAAEDQLPDLLVRHADSDQLRETIIMAAGHATPKYRSALLDGLLTCAEREPKKARHLRLLATACLETAHTIDPDVTDRVNTALDTALPPRSARESRSLARAGGRVIGKLPSSLDGLSAAAAAACVRTAALINGPDALRLIAGYASDPRHLVQRELADVWRYFDAEEYAGMVLAEAPLDDGRIVVRRRDHLSHTHLLTRLDSLDVPRLTHVLCNTSRPITDISPLLLHENPCQLHLVGSGVSADLRSLRQLPKLHNLDITCAGDGSVYFAVELSALTSLTINFQVSGTDLSPVSALHRLTHLELSQCPTDPTPYITNLPGLSGLVLNRTTPPNGLAGIRPLVSKLLYDLELLIPLPRLQHLWLIVIPELDVSPLTRLQRRARVHVRRKTQPAGLDTIRGRHRIIML